MKIPNILTIGRIIIVPIFVLTFFIPGFFGDLIPFFLFVLASFTDYLDGLLARLFKEESKLGELLDPIAEALQGLSLDRAIVVHGAGGLDEASLEGANEIRFVQNGVISSELIAPSDLGLSISSVDTLKGGDLECNKNILTNVLKGEATRPQIEVVALNTALVLWSCGLYEDLELGVKTAIHSLREGIPWKKLESLRNALESNERG